MHLRSIFVLLAFAATTAVAQEAYRWVDEDGVVHYSDRPREGAEQIVLPEPNVATGTVRRRAAAPSDEAPPEDTGPFRYESIEITSPGAEETLWNIEGTLNVSVSLTPALQSGHTLRYYYDGGEAQEATGTRFTLNEVWRGVHNLQVEVVDDTGQLMIRSRPSRFYVQQNTVNFGR